MEQDCQYVGSWSMFFSAFKLTPVPVLQDENIVIKGSIESSGNTNQITLSPNFQIRSAFLSEDPSVVGFVSETGSLYIFKSDAITQAGDDDSARLSQVAITATGRTCITFLASPGSQMIHILEFAQWADFLLWYSDPAAYPKMAEEKSLQLPQHYMLRGRVSSLLAGAVAFTMLTEAGEVYTWTPDARHHRCLGRAPSSDAPAEKPALVDALGGIPIAKLVVGGWMSVALSRDRDAYAWGRDKPSADQDVSLNVLPDQGEEIRLLEVGGGMDVIDAGVGSSHIALADAEGALWVAGGNDNGQLGLDIEQHVDTWTQVRSLEKKVAKVWCGDNCTFILLDS